MSVYMYEHETPSCEKEFWGSLLFCLCALVTYMYRYTYSSHHVYLIACHRVYGNTMIRGDCVEMIQCDEGFQ